MLFRSEIVDLANISTLDTKSAVSMVNALSSSFKDFEDVKKILILGADVLYKFPQLGEQYVALTIGSPIKREALIAAIYRQFNINDVNAVVLSTPVGPIT